MSFANLAAPNLAELVVAKRNQNSKKMAAMTYTKSAWECHHN